MSVYSYKEQWLSGTTIEYSRKILGDEEIDYL